MFDGEGFLEIVRKKSEGGGRGECFPEISRNSIYNSARTLCELVVYYRYYLVFPSGGRHSE